MLIQKFLPQAARETKEINKIVCLCLGSMQTRFKMSRQHPALGHLTQSPDSSFDQHLAARDIADTLDRVNGPETLPVKVYVQDGAYKDVDKVLLKDFGFEIVEDPHGWLKIDEHTLVFHAFCPFRPYEMIADLTHDYGGPAGILGDLGDLSGRGLAKIGPNFTTPRTEELLSKYRGHPFRHNEDPKRNPNWLENMALWLKIQEEN
jgi:hypothetical protein